MHIYVEYSAEAHNVWCMYFILHKHPYWNLIGSYTLWCSNTCPLDQNFPSIFIRKKGTSGVLWWVKATFLFSCAYNWALKHASVAFFFFHFVFIILIMFKTIHFFKILYFHSIFNFLLMLRNDLFYSLLNLFISS